MRNTRENKRDRQEEKARLIVGEMLQPLGYIRDLKSREIFPNFAQTSFLVQTSRAGYDTAKNLKNLSDKSV